MQFEHLKNALHSIPSFRYYTETSCTVQGNILQATFHAINILGIIQKFPDWPPGAKTANGTALCH
jgi:hypothetical protein